MKTLLLIATSLILISCIQHQADHAITSESLTFNDSVKIKYAEGFEVNFKSGFVEIITKSLFGNSDFSDTLFFRTDEKIDYTDKLMSFGEIPTTLACQSSTHLAYLRALNFQYSVKGICGLNYIQNKEMLEELVESGAQEICTGEQVQLEILQKINPDLFFIYPFETTGKEKYNSAGINTFYIAEYLEKSALARLEWVKLFGVICGKVKEANSFFELAEQEYLEAQSHAKNDSSTFILNLPYKDTWFMPSANSMLVQLIEDAGLNYFYPSSGSTENEIHPTEQVWNDGMTADYWIIIAGRHSDFSLTDLINESPVYGEFKAVKNRKVIFCNSSENDYFTTGVVEPQVILKDILYACGFISNHIPKYFLLLND